MKAIEITAFGAPEVLRPTERPDAGRRRGRSADPGRRVGHQPPRRAAAQGPLSGAARRVRPAGARSRRHDRRRRRCRRSPPPGSPSATASARSSPAAATPSYCVAPVGQCLPVPAGLSDVEAASLPETFFTVWSNVFDRARLQPGETLLVQGGSSGIGVTAIQLAKAHGATRDRHGGQRREGGGLQGARRRSRDQLQDAGLRRRGARASPAKRGVDVILDMVAGDYVARELKCLAEDGRLVIIAVQGGTEAKIDAGAGAAPPPDDHRLDAAAAPGGFQGGDRRGAARARSGRGSNAGRVKPVIHQVFPAADAAAGARPDGVEPAHRQAGARLVSAGRHGQRDASSSSATGR